MTHKYYQETWACLESLTKNICVISTQIFPFINKYKMIFKLLFLVINSQDVRLKHN